MAKEPKSTRTLSHAVKGYLNLEDMKVVEVLDAETGDEVVHDLAAILAEYDDKEMSITVSMKDKLEGE
ncbi:YonK family protein [Paenibacillus sp. Mc5Re-14]|uniref:YonK family protein n=1 Tax=Paenibacillus sp. Mc5Re-14 TaxID=1030529 RepID=UPI000AEF2B42|nr:YonK family protein [Paenibacillus sp. Mc5Re-14]